MLDGLSPSRLSSLHSCGCMHASRRSLAGLDRLVSCLLRLCLVTVVVARFNLCSLSVVLAHLSFIHPRLILRSFCTHQRDCCDRITTGNSGSRPPLHYGAPCPSAAFLSRDGAYQRSDFHDSLRNTPIRNVTVINH